MTDAPRTLLLPREGYRGLDSLSLALIRRPADLPGLLAAFRRLAAEHPGGRCYLTLDDVNQCAYTAGHAREKYALAAGIDYPEEDGAEALARFDAAVFAASARALRDPARTVAWEELRADPGDEEDIAILRRLNDNPEVLLEEVHVVQRVPSDADEDLLASLPNGYFDGDRTPFDCAAIIRRLVSRHGYALLGIGASTLAFHRTGAAPADIPELLADLRHLYGAPDSAHWEGLARRLATSGLLILGYTENVADLLD